MLLGLLNYYCFDSTLFLIDMVSLGIEECITSRLNILLPKKADMLEPLANTNQASAPHPIHGMLGNELSLTTHTDVLTMLQSIMLKTLDLMQSSCTLEKGVHHSDSGLDHIHNSLPLACQTK